MMLPPARFSILLAAVAASVTITGASLGADKRSWEMMTAFFREILAP